MLGMEKIEKRGIVGNHLSDGSGQTKTFGGWQNDGDNLLEATDDHILKCCKTGERKVSLVQRPQQIFPLS